MVNFLVWIWSFWWFGFKFGINKKLRAVRQRPVQLLALFIGFILLVVFIFLIVFLVRIKERFEKTRPFYPDPARTLYPDP